MEKYILPINRVLAELYANYMQEIKDEKLPQFYISLPIFPNTS
ncbi:hypothetical protein [Dysgonomonas sp. 520]|nr:hypothetical protein [Dysgonomonas sp. 520]